MTDMCHSGINHDCGKPPPEHMTWRLTSRDLPPFGSPRAPTLRIERATGGKGGYELISRLTTQAWAGFIVPDVIGAGAQTFWM